MNYNQIISEMNSISKNCRESAGLFDNTTDFVIFIGICNNQLNKLKNNLKLIHYNNAKRITFLR